MDSRWYRLGGVVEGSPNPLMPCPAAFWCDRSGDFKERHGVSVVQAPLPCQPGGNWVQVDLRGFGGIVSRIGVKQVRLHSIGEQVAESQAVGQLHERLPVRIVGPSLAFSPAPHRVAIGSKAAGNLRPRQARLRLEPLQPLREFVGEFIGASPVAVGAGRLPPPPLPRWSIPPHYRRRR